MAKGIDQEDTSTMVKQIENTILINEISSMVWEYLTNPELIKKWIGEPEMEIEVISDWRVGEPIVIKGFHHAWFENKGTVLRVEPNKVLQYSHLSSVSRLPEKIESYSIITFRLTEDDGQTLLTVKIENFPTETIFKHLDLYWKVTMGIIKKNIEEGNNSG